MRFNPIIIVLTLIERMSAEIKCVLASVSVRRSSQDYEEGKSNSKEHPSNKVDRC